MPPASWPNQPDCLVETYPEEVKETCLVMTVEVQQPIVALTHYTTCVQVQQVTAWMFGFFNNCRLSSHRCFELTLSPSFSVSEFTTTEHYWISLSQRDHFVTEVSLLNAKKPLPSSSCLSPFNPFLDSNDILRLGGRESNSNLSYSRCHLMILHGKHSISKLIICSEHIRLLHVGPTLLLASLSYRFHVVYLRKTVRSITRQCMTCQHQTVKP